jgi:hypothetical protein
MTIILIPRYAGRRDLCGLSYNFVSLAKGPLNRTAVLCALDIAHRSALPRDALQYRPHIITNTIHLICIQLNS